VVRGGASKRRQPDIILRKAFGDNDARDMLSLAWRLASEGSALSGSDPWLDQFANPRGRHIGSQDVTGLLDRVTFDGVMTFYKEWLACRATAADLALCGLTSISRSGKGADMAGWGHNRNGDKLPQVNLALLCERTSFMPLFAWPLDGSVSDARTLQNTLPFLSNFGCKASCLMQNQEFAPQDNITYMLKHGHVFLQA
jgi:hypothetical protein